MSGYATTALGNKIPISNEYYVDETALKSAVQKVLDEGGVGLGEGGNSDDLEALSGASTKAGLVSMGLNAKMVYDTFDGWVLHGNDKSTYKVPIKPYITSDVDFQTTFAGLVQADEATSKIGKLIDTFYTGYLYDQIEQTLHKNPDYIPSILTLSGEPKLFDIDNLKVESSGSRGIDITGQGTAIIKLGTYSEDLNLIGTLNDSTVKIVSSSVDLMDSMSRCSKRR